MQYLLRGQGEALDLLGLALPLKTNCQRSSSIDPVGLPTGGRLAALAAATAASQASGKRRGPAGVIRPPRPGESPVRAGSILVLVPAPLVDIRGGLVRPRPAAALDACNRSLRSPRSCPGPAGICPRPAGATGPGQRLDASCSAQEHASESRLTAAARAGSGLARPGP
jgi:hypothetical protein